MVRFILLEVKMTQSKNIAERYDPVTNTWETLNSMSVARAGLASAVFNGKLMRLVVSDYQVWKSLIH